MVTHSLHSFVRVILTFYEDVDTPISLGLYLRVKNGMWDEAIAVGVNPVSYLNHLSYLSDASCVAFLRKCLGLPAEADRRLNATVKWYEGERDCYKSNQRLVRYLPEFRNSEDSDPRLSNFFDSVRKRISDWIGPAPPYLLDGRFGPGTTSTDRGSDVTIAHKITNVPSLTRGCLPVLPYWARTAWGRSISANHGEIELVGANRFTTVPKTAITDRCIAAEPSINVFYQLALGRVLRRRLRRSTTLDLDNAATWHREAARVASIDNSFSTIDLSNASDTVSSTLVKLLIPPTWYEYLDAFRSKKTLIDGRSILLEKFSSMGNGFTFELETIIFLSLACESFKQLKGREPLIGVEVSCFGDDIILPDEIAIPTISMLRFCGFSVNTKKTFSGPSYFRESCGGDYFRGHFVRPFYCKEVPSEPQHWISIANGIRRVKNLLDPFGIDKPFRSWFQALAEIPSNIRSCRGPEALGDICIHDERPRWNYRWKDGVRQFRVWKPAKLKRFRWSLFPDTVVLACAVYGTGSGKHGLSPRDSVLSYRHGWVDYS